MDQSSDADTEQALRPICEADRRVRHHRLDFTGKPLALNQGFALARGRYLALTDDDCEVSPQWLARIVETFSAHPQVACVFGDVAAPPYDSSKGFIPVCRVHEDSVIVGLSEFLRGPGMQRFGIGANMALRSEVVAQLGGWDPWIGPGAKFGSGDDVDMTVRVLRAGHAIAFCAEARVLHFGMRDYASLAQQFGRNGFGSGAIFAKHLKCGAVYRGSLRLLRDRSLVAARNLIGGRRPIGAAFSLGWARGFRSGWSHPVDVRTRKFLGDPLASGRRYTHQVAQVVRATHP